jgi:transcriptional regulator of acetoin/glycerol metabolism
MTRGDAAVRRVAFRDTPVARAATARNALRDRGFAGIIPRVNALVLDDVSTALWAGYHDRDARLLRRVGDDALLSRWDRARRLGAPRSGGADEHHLERGAALALRTERLGGLLGDGAAVLQGAAESVSTRDFVLLLADADGVVLHTLGGGAFAEEARRVRLIEGACWSESARGTNAIGTALAEGTAVSVRGRAHFGERFGALVCTAAPVRDPEGRVLAVLDATSRLGVEDRDVGFVVRATARALEEVLRLRAWARVSTALLDTLARSLERMTVPAVLVESSGRVGRANLAARESLRLTPGHNATTELGVTWETLRDAALRGRSLSLRHRNADWTLRAEPLVGDHGAVLAVMAFLEPAARAPRALRASSPPPPADPFGALFAEDPTLTEAITRARRFASTAVPVVLLGETGSGKELMAQAIHAASPRAERAFIAMNCGAVAPQLLESELFGAAPHAFTGADPKGRQGLIEAAHGGTLFLDEVAEMPTPMQAALLRVLECGELRRVGETAVRRVDVRLVCATCRDLPALVRDGRFRSDLYYRLRGVTVTLPPLRARGDLVGLARHLLARLDAGASLHADAEAALRAHPWPGNVRELRSVLEVALALCDDGEIRASHLPLDVPAAQGDASPPTALAEVEGSVLRRVLGEVAGNVSAASKRLGVARSTLYRMMRRHGLEAPERS